MVYKLGNVRSDGGANPVTDRIRPLDGRRRVASGDRGDPGGAPIAELLAQIGTLGERLDSAAQRSVGALRQARTEAGVEAWNGVTAESLLDLADRIAAGRQRLDAALERDRARLRDAAGPADESAADAPVAMDPIRPGMI